MGNNVTPAPLVQIDKVEYNTYNHIDTAEILQRLRRIERKVEEDTEAEETLSAQNEELRKQLQDFLSGANLPPEVQEKVDAIFAASEAGRIKLEKAISENQPSQ